MDVLQNDTRRRPMEETKIDVGRLSTEEVYQFAPKQRHPGQNRKTHR
jgi:hypothetical protein